MSRLVSLKFISKVVEITTMRIDSCRNCGVTMKEFQRCIVCNDINQFFCIRCNKSSDEQIHPDCSPIAKEMVYN